MTQSKNKGIMKNEVNNSTSKIVWKPNRKKRKTSIVLYSIPQFKLPDGRRCSTESTEIVAILPTLTDTANMPPLNSEETLADLCAQPHRRRRKVNPLGRRHQHCVTLSSSGMATRLQSEDCRTGFHMRSFETGSTVHAASWAVDTGGCFSPPSSAGVNNAWIYISAPPIRLHVAVDN
jgi:hypothetical protein